MIRLIALLPLIALAVACEDAERLRNGKPTPVEARAEAPETTDATGTPVMSGADLYGLHCARCHGVAGDGKGTEKLETPARDFAAGGFSFGNTRTALFKTISRGIAGKEMPAFAEAMTEKERWRVIDHLLTLMPEQKEVDAKQRVLEPSDRPVIARGALYKKKGERAHITRGLMIGYPIGMSFEYRVDSPRLLRVREGGFVDRADWDGRGGALLEPLGKILHEASGGKAESTFRDAEGKPLAARYRGVTVEGDRAEQGQTGAVSVGNDTHRCENAIAVQCENLNAVFVAGSNVNECDAVYKRRRHFTGVVQEGGSIVLSAAGDAGSNSVDDSHLLMVQSLRIPPGA